MVSQIVENQPRHFSAIQNILAYGDLGAIRKDCDVVHMVCDAVSRRAAFCCAAGISAIARKIHANRPDEYLDITCGVDGSVYKVSLRKWARHPYTAFRNILHLPSCWRLKQMSLSAPALMLTSASPMMAVVRAPPL